MKNDEFKTSQPALVMLCDGWILSENPERCNAGPWNVNWSFAINFSGVKVSPWEFLPEKGQQNWAHQELH